MIMKAEVALLLKGKIMHWEDRNAELILAVVLTLTLESINIL
jgi:hypothetical protein